MKLINLLDEKKDDEEIVLQTAYALHRLLLFPQTRDELLCKTQVLTHLVDMLNDKNAEVRQTADKALDYVMDVSEEHAPKIRSMKFETFNQEWIQVVSGGAGRSGSRGYRESYEYDDEEDVDYGHSGELHMMMDHEEYDHGDFVHNANDAYMLGGINASEVGAYTSWQ